MVSCFTLRVVDAAGAGTISVVVAVAMLVNVSPPTAVGRNVDVLMSTYEYVTSMSVAEPVVSVSLVVAVARLSMVRFGTRID
jgi:hypothetical protein